DKLRDEISEIVGEIGKIKVQIKNLETDQKYYQDMLNHAEKLKKDLEKRFETLTNDEKPIFKQIQSVEEHRIEIQKEIEEVDGKLEEIKLEKTVYQELKSKYQEMYNRALIYEKRERIISRKCG
ncbi:MAG: DNA double-strand break repair protein Rad50, partial [Sweet potato little leaf phytoplasma]|nr:DNA double-strand break repair protein Rad50 [Sweet potato little leaf phytoplasma]